MYKKNKQRIKNEERWQFGDVEVDLDAKMHLPEENKLKVRENEGRRIMSISPASLTSSVCVYGSGDENEKSNLINHVG